MRKLACTLLFLAPAPAFAAGFTSVDPSVVAMGEGGTGTARASDPAASVYNPAAAGLEAGVRASVGVMIAAPKLTAERPDAWSASTEGGPAVPPHLHALWAGERFSAGASVTVPFGSSVHWPSDWPRRFDLRDAGLQVIRISAFGGARFGDLSVAAGPFIDLGTLELGKAIDLVDVEGTTSITMRGVTGGVHAGVAYRAMPNLDLGLSYRSRAGLRFEGYADFSVPPELSGTAKDQEVTAKITFPDRIALGAVWHPRDDVEVAADLEIVLWSTVDELFIDFSEDATPDQRQARDWNTTVTPRIGAAWRALDWLDVRAGFFVDPSPTPSATVGPSSPDSTRVGLSLGAGAALPLGLRVELAYQRLQMLGANAPASADGAVPAMTFSGGVHVAGLSLGWAL